MKKNTWQQRVGKRLMTHLRGYYGSRVTLRDLREAVERQSRHNVTPCFDCKAALDRAEGRK